MALELLPWFVIAVPPEALSVNPEDPTVRVPALLTVMAAAFPPVAATALPPEEFIDPIIGATTLILTAPPPPPPRPLEVVAPP